MAAATANIYGGDEVNALVVDVGSSHCKAGYAGDDIPKAVFPSNVGEIYPSAEANGMEVDGAGAAKQRQLFVGQSAVNYRRDHMEVVSPFGDDGYFSDWTVIEQLWDHAFRDRLRTNPAEYAVLLAEPNMAPKAGREKCVEILFEKFNVPAVFLAKDAVLSSFATARQTSLVVDVGHASTVVSAVHDGYLLNKSVLRSPIGGLLLSRAMQKSVESKGNIIRPRGLFKRFEIAPGEFKVEDLQLPNTTESYKQYQVDQITADIRESICRVSDVIFNEVENANIPTVSYELPDGTEIHVGPDRFKAPELLFQPQLLATVPGLDLRASGITDPMELPRLKLSTLITDCLGRCDVDVRKDLYQSIILTGGVSLTGGLRDRLERELIEVGPPAAKYKVVMPANPLERRFSVWIGGSILASLGSFQQMWMSKKEYEEHGASLIHRKAP